MAWDLAFAKFGRKMGLWVWHPFCQFCSIYGIGVEFYHFNSRCSCSKEMVDLVHLGMPEGPTHLNSRPPCVNVLIYFYALVFSGEQGMVDEAQKALEEAEALRKTDQKPRSCDICGAFLSVYDSDRCLADHFGGKLHLGYMQIREKLAELLLENSGMQIMCGICLSIQLKRFLNKDEREKKKKACEDERRSKERSRERDRGASKDRDQRESRERGRDYDRRSRDRDRHYDSDQRYERGRDGSHTYDSRSHRRSRSRSRERPRDYVCHRYALFYAYISISIGA
ncbi:hypothetical protein RHMOL_Rhmol05G0223800 [Rhododendron molle]|uniref:Uncharacterized protein n=1 Tax=Rhododendron molle TaxID=49168 RepID=A0ACC0NTJ5_RHOML|nr:hypothetical protein RHMOL_Rhmol05G0223800 [Rhododendron molle]